MNKPIEERIALALAAADDVKSVAVPALAHRLTLRPELWVQRISAEDVVRERLDTVLTRTIPSQHAKLEEYGMLESLKLPHPPPPLKIPRNAHGLSTQIFWDSDIGKWIEAASYALAHRRDTTIEAEIETEIAGMK